MWIKSKNTAFISDNHMYNPYKINQKLTLCGFFLLFYFIVDDYCGNIVGKGLIFWKGLISI